MYPNDNLEESEDESRYLNINQPSDSSEIESESNVESDGGEDEEEDDKDNDESEDCSDKDDIENNEDSSDVEDEEEEGEDETDDSYTDDDDDDERPIKRARRNFPEGIPEDEFNSDSSDGQSERCPICLSRFLGQEIGSPENCAHTFCLECISEWSKNVNTCPVDRKVFNWIFVRLTLIGKVVRQIPVESRQTDPEVQEEDPTYCEVCGRCDREDRLLLCDGCDLGFHLECLTPPLTTVPVEEWFCPDCERENQQNPMAEANTEEHEALSSLDSFSHPNNLRSRVGTRLLPRTQQSERVRRTIQQSRARSRGIQRTTVRSRANGIRQASTSSGRGGRSVRRRTSRMARKRKGTKKRKRVTKRKRGIGKKSKSSTRAATSKRRRRKKRKQQHRRRILREPKPMPVSTPKSRLAEQLGLKKILPNHFLPIMQAPAGNRVPQARQQDVIVPTFHLFGQRNELDPLSDVDDGGDVAVARVVSAYRNRGRMGKALSASAVLSHQPVTRRGPDLDLLARIAVQVPSEPLLPSEPHTFDLLGSILDSQSVLTFSSKNVTIKRDGSLQLNQLPINSVNQRPVDPVHSSRSGSSHKSNVPMSQPSEGGSGSGGSAGHRWSRSHRGSGSMSEMHSGGGSDRGGGSGEGVYSEFDGITRPSFPASSKKHDKRVEKEFKKQSEDDDIDIYSDIESGFDNESDKETLDQIGDVENLTIVDGHSPVSADNSQHHHLENEDSIDNDIGNCSDDVCSEDGLVIDESVKHDDGSESEHSDQNFDQSDGSEDNDLVIDKAGDKDDSEGENDVLNRPHGSSSPKVSLDIEDISTCDEEEPESSKFEAVNNATQLEDQDEGEDSVTDHRDEIESCSDSERGRAVESEPNDEVIQQPSEHDDKDENQAASADEELPENSAEGRENAEDQDGVMEDEDVEQSEHDLVEDENEPVEEMDEEEQEEEEEEEDDDDDGVEQAETNRNDGGDMSCPEGEEVENDQEEEDNLNPGLEMSNESRESGGDYIHQENPEVEPSDHDSENEVVQSEVSQNNLPEPLSNEEEEHLQNMAASLRELIESPDQTVNQVVEEGEIEEGEQFRRRKLRIATSGSGAPILFHRRQSPMHQQQRSRRRRGSRDYEEGEIVDDSPPPQLLRKQKGNRKSRTGRLESPEDYDGGPRVNIAELPRIPKLKRDSRTAVEPSEVDVIGGNPITGGSFDIKRTGVLARLDAGSTSEISWKKLSQNTRTRNYRAGKLKIEQKHLRLREAKKMAAEERGAVVDETKKRMQPEVVKDKRKEKERTEIEHYAKHTETKEWPRAKHEKRSSSKHDKEKEKHKEKHRDKHKGEKHKEWKEKHKHGSGKSREAPPEKLRDRSYDKYEKMALVDKKEKKEQKREKLRKELERIHREEKHREERQQHREHKKREKEKQQQAAAAAAAMVITNVVSLEQSREASPIESKEVYASGDSIIVNVNFSRPVGKENVLKESKGKDEKPVKNKDKEHSRKLELDGGSRERGKKTDAYPKEKFRPDKSSKKRELDEMKKESKRVKYDDSRVTHREVIVRSNQARWNPFGEDTDDPLQPLDLDQKSVGSDSPIIVQDDGTDARDMVSDSDDDIIEIIPCNVATGGGSAVDVTESNYDDDPSQSPVLVSEEADEFANYDSASNEQVPCSPPSPAEDNSVYDPFEPTKSPTPMSSPEPPSPPPSDNEKSENLQPPPPLPELPPLPPEPEPDDPVPPSPEVELEASPTSSLNVAIQSTPASSMPVPSLTPRRSPQAPPPVQSGNTPSSLPSPNLPPQCMPPPISLPNIRVPPPNYIPRNIPPSPGTASVPMPPIRPIGWPVGTPGLLFPPSQQLLRAAGNFMGPPPPLQASTAPSSHSVTLTQIGTLLHNQAAQLAILSGVRPPPAGMPPPIGLPTLLHPHSTGAPFLPSSSAVGSAQNGDMRRPQQDTTEVVDMDVDSPYSPGDTLDSADPLPSADIRKETHSHSGNENARSRDRFDSLLGSAQSRKENVPAKAADKTGHSSKGRGHGPSSSSSKASASRGDNRHRDETRRRAEAQRKHIVRFEVPDRQAKALASTRGGAGKDKKPEDGKKEVTVKMDETQLKILDELPSLAVEMQVKEKFLKKLNRQERVIEEVKLAIKPYYNKREINKEEYKEILRKSVPKICHNKSGEINPVKIKALVEGYVKKFRYHRKKEGKTATSKKS